MRAVVMLIAPSLSWGGREAARDLGRPEASTTGERAGPGRAREMTPRGAGFDLVLDSVGRWAESIACLRPGGRCVVLGASAGDQASAR